MIPERSDACTSPLAGQPPPHPPDIPV